MRRVTADLHLHTVLSACAEVEMIPPLIVRQALAVGLDMIAVTDHNSAENCAAVMQAASGTGLTVLPGMEVQTAEEVHVVCLFGELEQALTWQGIVLDHLPDLQNSEERIGAQYVVDASGAHLRTEQRMLATSTDLSLEDVLERVLRLGGIAIPAHIDRTSFSLLANLGFVPHGLPAPALEIFRRTDPSQFRRKHPELSSYPLVRGGDAHRLGEIKVAIELEVAAPTLEELALALKQAGGRSACIACAV